MTELSEELRLWSLEWNKEKACGVTLWESLAKALTSKYVLTKAENCDIVCDDDTLNNTLELHATICRKGIT